MNPWKQIDALKAKYENDLRNVEAAAKAYGFVGTQTLPHGVWVCRSRHRQKHEVELSAPNADDLCRQMQEIFQKATKVA